MMSRVTWGCNIYSTATASPAFIVLYTLLHKLNFIWISCCVLSNWREAEPALRLTHAHDRKLTCFTLFFIPIETSASPRHHSAHICMIMMSNMGHKHESLAKLTPRSWVLLEKPPVAQLLKNFPIRYGTRTFITVLITALHWSLSWARWIHSVPPNPISQSWKN
jgi:hypothetical protein